MPANSTMSSTQKVATVLLTVDSEIAAEIIKRFSEKEIALVGREMHNQPNLKNDEIRGILVEFHERCVTGGAVRGSGDLRAMLESALGSDRSDELLEEMGIIDHTSDPFNSLKELSAEELGHTIGSEHPQVIAVVLSHLDPKLSAQVLAVFSEEKQVDIVRRMANVGQTSDQVVRSIDEILSNTAGSIGQRRKTPVERRYKAVADILNLLRRETEQQIMERLAEDTPEVAENVRNYMFVFEDLRHLSDADIRKVLMTVDSQVLALALKTATEGLQEKVFKNLSKRAAENVREEQEMLGPRPLSQVEAAQRQVAEVVRNLDAAGELNSRGGSAEEDPLV